jgi:hypothetical protein
VLAKSQAELDRTIRAARFDRDNEAEARRTAEATIARVRQMADAWEQRLPAKILTATAVEALRRATERYALAQPRQQGAAVGMVAPMTWYEQRPPRIEAMHWTGDNLADIQAWAGEGRVTVSDGTTTDRTTPIVVPGVSGVTQVAAGGNVTLAKSGPPELTTKATITGSGTVGATLTCSAAFLTATSVGYTWLRDGAAIPGATIATYTPVAADAGHKATCQVTATNTLGSTDTSATITVAATTAHTPAQFTAGTPPTAHLGTRYSYRFAATGSPAPKIARVSGTLPPGLKLATNGTLSGTPTRKGTYRFTLSATNGIGTPAKANESIIVR